MVKKLFKYDFAALAKTLLPCELVMLGAAFLNRIIQFAEPAEESVLYTVPFALSTVAFGLALMAVSVIVFVLIIVRFYKNMYTNEGYLTFTLPVSTDEHLIVKTLVAFCFIAIHGITTLLSFVIILSGDPLVEACRAFQFLGEQVASAAGVGNLILYIAEFIVLLIFNVLGSILFYYFCLTVGQLAKRHRVALAVGVYIGTNALLSFIATTFFTVFLLSADLLWLERTIQEFLEENTIGAVHGFFLIAIFINMIVVAVLYFFTRLIMKKKLNLE